jgi:uncharacterized protein (TIGR02145 family)
VRAGSYTLAKGDDYTESWSGNDKAGTATLTITGKGSIYTGSASKNFTIGKADGADVSEPVASKVTDKSITVGAVTITGNICSQIAEYAISEDGESEPSTGWQDGTTFDEDVKPETEYYVFARSAANDNCNAGEAKMSDAIETLELSNTCGTRTEVFDPKLYECRDGSKIYLIGGLKDERDGQKYEAVLIGTQTWMAKDLNYGTNKYNWATAMGNAASSSANPSGVQGICPEGWHLPSYAEWSALSTYATNNPSDNKNNSAIKLKATTRWTGANVGTDYFGFAALPASNNENSWWTSTQNNETTARRYYMTGVANLNTNNATKTTQYSVRCVKDNP